MRQQSLVEMALSVRQLLDLDGQDLAFGANSESYVTDQEMTYRLNESVAALYDLIRSKFGQNYYWAIYSLATVSGTYAYQLPYDVLDIVDASFLYGNSNQYRPIPPLNNFREQYTRNTVSTAGYPLGPWSNLRWQFQGQTISFYPTLGSLPGTIRLQYTPAAPWLCQTLPVAWAPGTVVAQGTIVLAPVLNPQGVSVSQGFIALNGGTTGALAPTFVVPGTTPDNGIVWAYKAPASLFATTFDGISGWEYWAILDCAMKLGAKQEQDISSFQAEMARVNQRIEWAAANRQSGDPLFITPGYGEGEGGGNSGGWGGGWGGY